MRDLIVSAVILGALIVGVRAYEAHHHEVPENPGPPPSGVTTDGSDTCDRLTKYLQAKGYTVDGCSTEDTVPDRNEPHPAAHT